MTDSKFKSIMLAEQGSHLIGDIAAHTYAYRAIVVREDTVIATWKDMNGLDLVAHFGIAAKVLLATDPVLLVPFGQLSKTITLTSGSIWGIK